MAQRKPRRKRDGTATAGGRSDDGEGKLIAAAMALAARQGWRRTGLSEIAAEAGLSLAEAHALHATKLGILNAFMRRIDRAVLEGIAPSADEAWRDRLFDVLMPSSAIALVIRWRSSARSRCCARWRGCSRRRDCPPPAGAAGCAPSSSLGSMSRCSRPFSPMTAPTSPGPWRPLTSACAVRNPSCG
jgi:hypothetical protein